MGFWAYSLINSLLIPVIMLIFSRYISVNGAPKNINGIIGYRTHRSMRNWSTWVFAHKHFAKFWTIAALVMIPVSIAAMLFTIKLSVDAMTFLSIFIMGLQSVVLVISIFLTESAIKKNFDAKGDRTEESLKKEQDKAIQAQQKAQKKQTKEKVAK